VFFSVVQLQPAFLTTKRTNPITIAARLNFPRDFFCVWCKKSSEEQGLTRRGCTKNAPELHRNCTGIAPELHRICTENAPPFAPESERKPNRKAKCEGAAI
jgi:hypothetical protein